ncbi:helix-turn-helix transcriptional regulator [Actinoplanes sp. NPDC023801]|uniref:helix-turn-helix transcriptional regulator n=1 Tax=Actinoplanes sp. NPDC023801 TaxID=3154595 RepID=UPI00340F6E5A
MPTMLVTPVTARSAPGQRAARRDAATVLTAPASVDAALAAATREVLIAGWYGADGTLGRADRDNLRRGVRYRVLLPDSARDRPAVCRRFGCLAGDVEVRTVPVVPAATAVIDAAVALFPAARPADGVALVTLTGVVAGAVALFERLWDGALPLSGDDGAGGRERELLALMSAGHTDESAAARLGVSVRTVRRMMSALMVRLGARSRFQAGLRAAGRGLLTPPC